MCSAWLRCSPWATGRPIFLWCSASFRQRHSLGQDGADHRIIFQDGGAADCHSARIARARGFAHALVPASAPQAGQHSYNEVLPLMLARYCGPGLLGLGITALVAGFMAGMAGNVSAFATVWTYDIYRPYLYKTASDRHYVSMGAGARSSASSSVLARLTSSCSFASIMDYVQALFGFFIAPLFGTVLLGMLWKRVKAREASWDCLAGTVSSVTMFASDEKWIRIDGCRYLRGRRWQRGLRKICISRCGRA